jgi:hypothetical protein
MLHRAYIKSRLLTAADAMSSSVSYFPKECITFAKLLKILTATRPLRVAY